MRRIFTLTVCLYTALQGIAQQQTPVGSYKLFFEQVYVQTDRERYAAGEDIWFSAFLVNARDHTPSGGSNNLYVELLSDSTEIITRQTIRIDNGAGHGDFHLDEKLPPGNYRLRAYTNWMLNYGDKFIFNKTIQVHTTQGVFPVVKGRAAPTVRFFPEGGSMVAGIAGLIAVKASDANGHGLAAKGILVSSAGDTVTTFKCNASGFGAFMLSPAVGATYTAVSTAADMPFSVILPEARTAGYSLHATRTAEGELLLFITGSRNGLAAGDSLMIAIRNKDAVVLKSTFRTDNGQASLRIPQKFLPPGISAVTLYNEAGRPECERLVYTDNGKPGALALTTDKPVYAPLEKATLALSVMKTDSIAAPAVFSVAVVDERMADIPTSSIRAYFELQSELRGPIEHAASYFDERDPGRLQKLDLLLLTQGWRNFLWKRLADSAITISKAMEKGFTVSGKVTTNWFSKPLAGLSVTVTTWADKTDRFRVVKTDSAGRFEVTGLNFDGVAYIGLTATDKKGKKTGLMKADTVMAATYPVTPFVHFTYELPQQSLSEARRRFALTRISFPDTTELKTVELRAKKYPGRIVSDTTITVSRNDYKLKYLPELIVEHYPGSKLNGMSTWAPVLFWGLRRDFLKGWVGGLYTDRERGSPRLRRGAAYARAYAMINYATVPADQVISFEVVKSRWHSEITEALDGTVGDVFDIFVKLKPGAYARQGYDGVNFDQEGYYSAREFYAPDHSTPDAIPDLRATLHWAPAVLTGKDGKSSLSWYNTSVKGKVRVIAEGMDKHGALYSGIYEYEVK